jgi:sugar lactone lactonase YvrE
VAGNGTRGYSGDGGQATSALVNNRYGGVALDASGNIYIADVYNNRIRKVTIRTGDITTVAGTGTSGYSGDGGQATSAMMESPYGVALDASGNIYFADSSNYRIRKVTISTGDISTVAGTGTSGYSGDGGQATSAMIYPAGVALDAIGNIYIADFFNNRIRKVTISTDLITTVTGTGNGGYNGDGGQATSAMIHYPEFITLDSAENIYFTDYRNDRIRKVTISTGIISTVAGTGASGYTGDGGQATSAMINYAYSVALDASGNIYIADTDNYRIRKVTVSTGVITTVAGNGTRGYSGDGGQATSAMTYPYCVALDASENIYFSDDYGIRVFSEYVQFNPSPYPIAIPTAIPITAISSPKPSPYPSPKPSPYPSPKPSALPTSQPSMQPSSQVCEP